MVKQDDVLVQTQGLTAHELSYYDCPSYKEYLNKATVKAAIANFLRTVATRYKEKVPLLAKHNGMWGAYLELQTIATIEHVCFIVHTEGFAKQPGPPLPPVGEPTNPRIYLWLIGENIGCGHYSLLIRNNNIPSMQPAAAGANPAAAGANPAAAGANLAAAGVNPMATTLTAFTVQHIAADGDCLFSAAIQGIKILRQANCSSSPNTATSASQDTMTVTLEEILALRKKVSASMDEEFIKTLFENYIFTKGKQDSLEARLRLPQSELSDEAALWRVRLSIAMHASDRLRTAASRGDCMAILQLIIRDVDINAQEDYHELEQDNSKNTALHAALISLQEEISKSNPTQINIDTLRSVIKLLRDHGARDDIANSLGLTAQVIAAALEEILPPMRIPLPALRPLDMMPTPMLTTAPLAPVANTTNTTLPSSQPAVSSGTLSTTLIQKLTRRTMRAAVPAKSSCLAKIK